MTQAKKTRAAVPPPKQKSFLPDTKAVQPANNMKEKKEVPMTFNMPKDWHTEFKTTSIIHGYGSMKEFLFECFAAWKREQEAKK
jgi:hypothetical protein